ncbi:MAG: hypothetical protein ACYCO9_09115 [Streptosporangiaceae bacterium]
MSLRYGKLLDATVRTEYERALDLARQRLGAMPAGRAGLALAGVTGGGAEWKDAPALKSRRPAGSACGRPPRGGWPLRRGDAPAGAGSLPLARQQIRRLRADNEKLRGRLRLQLGAEIEGPDRAELIARVASLQAAARQLTAERDARAAEISHAQRRVRELEDDLTAARQSLRRAIRQANR